MVNKRQYHINNTYLTNPLKFDDIHLIQIGRRYCEPAECVPIHTHENWFELTIVTFGEANIQANDDITTVRKGDIYLSFTYEIHSLTAGENTKFEYDFFSFYTDNESLNGEFEKIMESYCRGKDRVFRDDKISFLIANSISEFSAEEDFYELLTHLFKLVIIYIIRNFNNKRHDTSNVSNAEILCFQLMNYIDTHIYTIQNLEEIAPHFSYNYSYLSTLFKNTTGKTLFEYYQNRKLEMAKMLVIEKKKKIGEIAEMFNYSSLFSFSKAFKAKFGISPKLFRSMNQ